jgi:hypothetical protein
MNVQYQVLNPWAEADPVPLKGLSPRINDLTGKKIGLFHHTKPSGPYITAAVEQKLKNRFPTADFSYFRMNRVGDLDDYKDRVGLPIDPAQDARELALFDDWVKWVDAVVGAVGD